MSKQRRIERKQAEAAQNRKHRWIQLGSLACHIGDVLLADSRIQHKI
jgi:hypothetical protein